ncbi:DUF4440 domain-containing protein, partial [Streptomyces sp. NPDC006978]|uniref:DUF4440 domain-containing protein n=1 Tax=Streptomyces sp. NPDC006978 TaxID=3364769 RepID=UPI003675DFBD
SPVSPPVSATVTSVINFRFLLGSYTTHRTDPPDAVYWFSDGSHRGREAVLSAIAKTFATIRDEVYQINDLEWITYSDQYAVCRYRFAWTGIIDGQPRSGNGRGTTCSSATPEPGRCFTNTSAHSQGEVPIHRS